MHDGVGLGRVTQPQAEGEHGMARRQRGVVIGGAAVGESPALRRQRHQHGAEPGGAEPKSAVDDIVIVGWIAPRRLDCAHDLGRKRGEQTPVVGERKRGFGCAGLERFEHFGGAVRLIADAIAGGAEVAQQGQHAGRHVETHGIAGAATRRRIVGHQHGDTPLAAWCLLETDERRNPVGHHGDTVRLGAAGMGGEAKRGVFGERVLEGDGARQHAAVKLGQHHMHGEVGRPKPARALLPGSAPRGRDHRLQHRRVDRVERRRSRRRRRRRMLSW